MAWDLKGSGGHSADVVQQMKDGARAAPGQTPPDAPNLVGLLIESLCGSTGNAPVGKLWQAESTGDTDKGELTVTVSTVDDPAAQKAAPASEGPTATPAPAPHPSHKGK